MFFIAIWIFCDTIIIIKDIQIRRQYSASVNRSLL